MKTKLKIGDKVVIWQTVKEQKGWTDIWTDPMTRLINRRAVHTVDAIGDAGVLLNGIIWGFPSNALRKVKQ